MGGVREGIDFFPLSVEYEERLYASGKIPGSFFRREGRPSTEAILTARLTDRPLRPLFPKGMRNEVQIIMFSMSSDSINPLDILAINAASRHHDLRHSLERSCRRSPRRPGRRRIRHQPHLRAGGRIRPGPAHRRHPDAILMVECGANEVPEDVMVAALELGHKAMQPLIDLQFKMQAEVGKEAREGHLQPARRRSGEESLRPRQRPDERTAGQTLDQSEFYGGMTTLKEEVVKEFYTIPDPMSVISAEAAAKDYPSLASIREAFDQAEQTIVRERILGQGKRPDGRGPKDLRPSGAKLTCRRARMAPACSPVAKPRS
jgi:polyribonucleotide nucleotidyltransferase